MGNYDQMAAAVSELSGGKNVVLLDDIGMPSIYVRIPKGKNSELVSGLSDNVHYAFNVDSVEKTAFYYSKDKVDDSIMRVLSKEIASELMEITFGDNG